LEGEALYPNSGPNRGRAAILGRVDLRRAAVAGVVALVSLLVVSFVGGVHADDLQHRLVAFAGCLVFAVAGVIAVRSASEELSAVVAVRGGHGVAGIVRLLTTVVGYLMALVTLLSLLELPVHRLLLSGAITGVILGIAGQQSLANLFAGLLLLTSRPFTVGQWIVVSSGTLGGSYEGRVRSIGLTFTTLDTEDGPLHLPNLGLISAATGPRTPPQTPAEKTLTVAPAHGTRPPGSDSQARSARLARHP
jgi:small-conductance mechanosensitive channel